MTDRPQILDACCGGRMWWWDKEHPLAVYMDKHVLPKGVATNNRNWECAPNVVADFRAMPFKDEAFQLVLYDPPHVIRETMTGNVTIQYGALPRATEQDDLRRGFDECWRVLAPGGTLIFKWAGPLERVQHHFPTMPVVGTRSTSPTEKLGTRWFIFYKSLGDTIDGDLYEALLHISEYPNRTIPPEDDALALAEYARAALIKSEVAR